MRLSLGFALRTVLITQECFVTPEQCSHTVKTFSASHPSPPVNSLRVHKGMGGNTGRKLTPIYPKDIPYHMELFLAFRAAWRRKRRMLCLDWWHLPPQVTVTHDGALLCRVWLNNSPLIRSSFIVLLWLCAQLLLCIINCLYLNSWVFSLLLFQFSPPSCCRVGKRARSCVGLNCRWG